MHILRVSSSMEKLLKRYQHVFHILYSVWDPDSTIIFLGNTSLKCNPGTRMEPLAQTWQAKMWW